MISEGALVFNEYLENVLIKRKRLHDYLKTITSDTNVKYLPNNFTVLFDIIYSCDIEYFYKLETTCYFINKYINYCLEQNNDPRILTAINYIKTIIDENNSIKTLKNFDDKIEFSFMLLGVHKKYSSKIIDCALRNYESEINYGLKKTNF